MPFYCPNNGCHEEIESLLYSVGVTEFGNYYIEREDWDTDDTETSGEYRYECPECNNELDLSEVLTENPNEEDEDEDTEHPQRAIEKAEQNTEVINFCNEEAFTQKGRQNIDIIKCERCSHMFSVEDRDLTNLICTNCSHAIKTKLPIKV